MYEPIQTDLMRFGEDVSSTIYESHLQCEREPPRLQTYDAWGNRVDHIITSPAWKRMHQISAQEGLIAIPYEQKYAQYR